MKKKCLLCGVIGLRGKEGLCECKPVHAAYFCLKDGHYQDDPCECKHSQKVWICVMCGYNDTEPFANHCGHYLVLEEESRIYDQ